MSFISIITPSYNDINLLKQEIPSLISYLKAKNYQFEFIVVDDGSNQKTACEEFCAQVGIKFLFNEVNLGKGAAVKKGMMAASGDVRIFTDCDIPFEYENIEQCISVIENEGADLAIGNRRMKDSQYYNKISFLRNVGSKLFTFFVGKFVTTGLFDTQCGLKAFRGEVANFLFSRSRIIKYGNASKLSYSTHSRQIPLVVRYIKCNASKTRDKNDLRYFSNEIFSDEGLL